MTEKQINYFFTVYEQGNIAKAAAALLVSRPVISRALADIEKETGIRLFDRISSGVVPTEQGVTFYNMLDSISKAYSVTVEKLKNPVFLKDSRSLRIGIQNVSCNWFYPLIYRPFHEKYPDTIVKVEGVKVAEAFDSVIDGSLDIAIAPILTDKSPLIGTIYLYTTQWVLCAPKNAVKTTAAGFALSEVANLPIAILETLRPPFYEYKNAVLSTIDPEMVRIAIANEYAFAVLPMELCVDWDDVSLIPFTPPVNPSIYMVWNKALPHNTAFDNFMGIVKDIDFSHLRSLYSG